MSSPERITKDQPELSIIILNWNSVEYLRECLKTVKAEVKGIAYEIIVIDGASYDGCDRMLATDFPQVRFLQHTSNVGFARANNRAAQEAKGEYFLFLNPDTEIKGDAIQQLLAASKSLENAGVVGPKLLNSDGSIQTSCVQAFPNLANQFLDSNYLRRLFPGSALWGNSALFSAKTPTKVDVISGACLMIRASLFRDIGGFEEEFFMYSEDVELCHATRNRGWEVYFVPSAEVLHHGGGSSEKAPSSFSICMLSESRWRYFRKTRSEVYAELYKALVCVSACIRLAMIYSLRPWFGANRENTKAKWRILLAWSLGNAALRH